MDNAGQDCALANALKRFNRKERNLLIREALGDEEKQLCLGKQFRTKLEQELSISVQQNAWWATDYHISWLAGALDLYSNGEARLESAASRPNPRGRNRRCLIEPNQQDIDMVVASGLDLILIEAKAYGSWANSQMTSKIQRLTLLKEFYDAIAGSIPKPIAFHFVLASFNEPTHLNYTGWPPWALKGTTPRWIKLPKAGSILEVTRCDARGNQSAEGQNWKIKRKWLNHAGLTTESES
jgi:hypothetical protein